MESNETSKKKETIQLFITFTEREIPGRSCLETLPQGPKEGNHEPNKFLSRCLFAKSYICGKDTIYMILMVYFESGIILYLRTE